VLRGANRVGVAPFAGNAPRKPLPDTDPSTDTSPSTDSDPGPRAGYCAGGNNPEIAVYHVSPSNPYPAAFGCKSSVISDVL
jgi:hypothetical protein